MTPSGVGPTDGAGLRREGPAEVSAAQLVDPGAAAAALSVERGATGEMRAVFGAANALLSFKAGGGPSPALLASAPTFGQIEGEPCGGSGENCYLYALDLRSTQLIHGFPGQIAHIDWDGDRFDAALSTLDGLVDMLRDDGLEPIGHPSNAAYGERPVAAYFKADEDGPDYHFIRLDADGGWSEKFGDEPPVRVAEGPVARRADGYELAGVFAYRPERLHI